MRVLLYRSAGMDDQTIVCRDVREAVMCFKADAQAIFDGEQEYEIDIRASDMTLEQIENAEEV